MSRWLASGIVFGILMASCTPDAQKAATQAAGGVCEVVFTVVGHPELAPLCTTASQLAQAVEGAIAAQRADGGIQMLTMAPPDPLVVYAQLRARGATPVKP